MSIKTIEPYSGSAFVVWRPEIVHESQSGPILYAEAHPAWLRGTGGELWPWRPLADAQAMALADRYGTDRCCRWYDELDDATWFVREIDAIALALLVDGRVVQADESDEPFRSESGAP